MTDGRPDLDETRLVNELATWFAGEVRQAELDLRRAPLRPARARRGPARGIAAPAAGAILVVVLVIAGITRLPSLAGPATEPTGSAAPPASFTAPEPVFTNSPDPGASIDRRYPDGIPASIDGERVVRPSTIDQLGPNDDRSFLLGGWSFDFAHITPSCGLRLGTAPPFGLRCGNPFLTDDPLGRGITPVFLDGWTPSIGVGPVIVRAHRHDEMAATCLPEARKVCEAIAFIEAVVWTGDVVTATAPMTPIEAFARLNAVDPDMDHAFLTAVGRIPQSTALSVPPSESLEPLPTGVHFGGGFPPPCELPLPTMSWSVFGARISHVAVFPSTAARETLDRTQHCLVVINADALFVMTWVRVDNVMVAVNVNPGGRTQVEADLIDDIQAALERM
jgi:hypothetical protein